MTAQEKLIREYAERTNAQVNGTDCEKAKYDCLSCPHFEECYIKKSSS